MKVSKRKQRLVALALAVALLASLTLVSASSLAVVEQDVLINGNFEGGFAFVPGCGNVGQGWGCFTNGGSVQYGFYDDQWAPVVADGAHAQLIELSTMGFPASENDHYAGIYQTVKLVKGATYQLKLQGLMREQTPDPRDDPWRYRVQWGYTADGSTDWHAVANWKELNWDNIYLRTSPGALQSYSDKLVAPSDKVTLFLRVWKKWATTGKELNVDLDAIILFGPAARPGVVAPPPPKPLTPAAPAAALVCAGPNLLANGDFEGGFNNGIPNGWGAFNNGGAAAYGYYDEMWKPVVKSGSHGALLEINTWGQAASDPDRVSGLFQTVNNLKPGATYQFSLYGMMREEAAHSGEDMYRYRVQWGYAPAGASPDLNKITNWAELPWDTIYVRTAPGAMSFYSVQFTAPANSVIIAVRAWKKWPTPQRELDVNLDAITLQGCGATTAPPPQANNQCGVYVVRSGDTLYRIALSHGDVMAAIVERNKIANPNLIRVGQKLIVCDP